MISDRERFQVLYEKDELCVGCFYEEACLVDKRTKKEIYLGDFYGDPYCATISTNNDWCAVGGEYLAVWVKGKGVTEVNDHKPNWIFELKQRSDHELEIHVESDNDAPDIWLMDIFTLERTKITQDI